MKSLKDIAKDVVATYRTDLNPIWVLDKNVCTAEGHCYIDEVYEKLFAPYRITARKVLEIGVHYGGSMLLWQRYFPHAAIHGLDIEPKSIFQETHDRVHLSVCNAYTQAALNSLDNDYNIIIDDGDHTLDSMRFVVKNYLAKLAPNGMLVIEDIPDNEWLKILIDDLELNGYRTRIQAFDLRNINRRFDDMVLTVQRID